MKERIDNLLVKRGFFESRQKAKYEIENSNIYVNGNLVDKPSKMYDEIVDIQIQKPVLAFVSRGGLKLDKAVKVFNIDLQNKICVDIGASKGGFTDCMLQNGANKVYSIDVGHGQLDKKLIKNSKVINIEGKNIRDIDVNEFEKVDFISIDVSFISLTLVLDKAYELLKQNGEIVILIKPQFEAGKEYVNKNGVVKDKKVHAKVIEKILLCANSMKFNILQIDFSPIKGPAGNIEYIVYMRKENEQNKFDLFSLRKQIQNIIQKAYKELK